MVIEIKFFILFESEFDFYLEKIVQGIVSYSEENNAYKFFPTIYVDVT